MTVRKYSKTTFSLMIIIAGLILIGSLLIERYLPYSIMEPFTYKIYALKWLSGFQVFVIKFTSILLIFGGISDAILKNRVGMKVFPSMIVPLIMCIPIVIFVYVDINETWFWLIVFIDYIIADLWAYHIVVKDACKENKNIFKFIAHIKNGPDKEDVNKADKSFAFVVSVILVVWWILLLGTTVLFAVNNKEVLFSAQYQAGGQSTAYSTEPSEEMESAAALDRLKLYVNNYDGPHLASETPILFSDEDSYTASSTLYKYYADNLFDWDTETNWQEGVDGSGIGESLEINFSDTQTVAGMAFYMGSWVSVQKYYENNRPSIITLQLEDKEFELDFPDVMERHYLYFSEPVNIDYIRITIDDVYRGNMYDDTVISEINIFPLAN